MPGLPNPQYVSRESRFYESGARAPLAGVSDRPDDPPMSEQTPSFGISSGLILTAAYVVLGKLGLMLAVPPGYASGIFPPAGLAIAATYLWGRSALPWIVLGSLTLNLSVTATSLHTSAIVAALCIAVASALQAWIGRVVLHRAIRPQRVLRLSNISRVPLGRSVHLPGWRVTVCAQPSHAERHAIGPVVVACGTVPSKNSSWTINTCPTQTTTTS